jgi:hypothetical protein
MPDVTQALRDARDLLLVANRDNPKALGDFGYVIDDSPRPSPKLNPRPLSPVRVRQPADRRAALWAGQVSVRPVSAVG